MTELSWQCPSSPVALWKPTPLQWCASENSVVLQPDNDSTEKVPVYAYNGQNLYANPWINELERVGYLYVVPVICSFGVLLNLFTIFILNKKGFQGPPVVLLKGLAAADIVTTAITLPFGFAYCILCPYNHKGYTQLVYQIYIYGPITNISESVSAWTTIVLGTERLVSIKNMSITKHQETGKVYFIFVMVVLAAFALNFPFFYAFQVESVGTLYFEKVYTDFGTSMSFSLFSWIRAILSQFFPLVYLCVINAMLLYHVGRSVERCRKFSVLSNQSRREKAQMRMTAMLTGTIILFIAGHIPVAFAYVAIFEAVFGPNKVPSDLYSSFRVITHSIALLSYTLDFVVYCLSNRHFRNAIINTFVNKRKVSDLNITLPTIINIQTSFPLGTKIGPQSTS